MAIAWLKDLDSALAEAKSKGAPVLAYFSASPFCGGCVRMDTEVYPDSRVENFIAGTFTPVLIHMKDQPAMFDRFDAQITPAVVIFDVNGEERHRVQGFLPPDDFLSQMELGASKAAKNE